MNRLNHFQVIIPSPHIRATQRMANLLFGAPNPCNHVLIEDLLCIFGSICVARNQHQSRSTEQAMFRSLCSPNFVDQRESNPYQLAGSDAPADTWWICALAIMLWPEPLNWQFLNIDNHDVHFLARIIWIECCNFNLCFFNFLCSHPLIR